VFFYSKWKTEKIKKNELNRLYKSV
jgi:hypothetical protein